MKALLPSRRSPVPSSADALRGQQDSIQTLLKPLLDLAENSEYLIAGSIGEFLAGGELFQIPRFTFIGPTGGGEVISLGIFAAVHGDEFEEAAAVIEFLKRLESRPRLAKGYHLHIYPICDPAGLVVQSRKTTPHVGLSTPFWRGSARPEIYYLEKQLEDLCFHAGISIGVENESDTFLLRANTEILNRHVVYSAIEATQRLLPVKVLSAESGNHSDSGSFEIHIGIPRFESALLRINGTISLLNSILDAYRSFVSIGRNLQSVSV